MTRQLRPRKSRPSYVAMAGLTGVGDDDEDTGQPAAGPSAAVFVDEEDGGSDFAPERDAIASPGVPDDGGNDDEDDDMDLDLDPVEDDLEIGQSSVAAEDEQLNLDDGSIARMVDSAPLFSGKGKGKAKAKTKEKQQTLKSKLDGIKPITGHAPGLARTSKRQMYVLPTPSVHHRHRAVPLFSRDGRVERLTSRPSLFKSPAVTLTNNFTHNAKATDRINKSWGYNVGSGPLWEMVEDRGWYKEALTEVDDPDSDASRRPRVYQDVCVKQGWEVLKKDDATPYLPSDDITTEEGNLKPPPPVPCSFGPYGSQTRVDMQMFDAHHISNFIPEGKAHVFNAGAPVWGLDWCPVHFDDRPGRSFKQYLAVAPFPSSSHSPEIGTRVPRPSYACIQIWSLGPTRLSAGQSPIPASKDSGEMRCEMVLCLDGGAAHDLKWCPLPSHDITSDAKRPRKLGLIAGTFEDGSFSVYAVPDPRDVASPETDISQPIYVKLPEPLLRIELEETSCWSFDWANSELVAIGTTNGTIAVYDLGPSLKSASNPRSSPVTGLLPTHYLTVHQSAIRALSWIKVPPSWPSGAPRVDDDPTVIASGGYDGVECMTDIRESHASVMNRTRDVINAMAFSPFAGGPITIDHENIVKAYSASPSMLGRGHTLLEPQGPVWTVNSSDYHPQLAIGSADGSLSTTNTLRSTRRGGSVPFFVHKIYQLDYSRNTKEYRMLERFLPQETQDRPTATRAAKGKIKELSNIPQIGTGAWPREVGIHRITWNSTNGLAAAGLLASATASGLCRVDVLWGRWIKGKIPYGGIENIRRELEGDGMDLDSDDSAGSG